MRGVLCFVALMFIGAEVVAEDFMEDFKREAQGYIDHTSNPRLIDEVKNVPNYTESPKESSLDASSLRALADDKVKGVGVEEPAEREAINGAKSSYMQNPHRSKYTAKTLENKDFIKKSDSITENPISGLNASAESGCRVADKETSGENVRFEEYYVDVMDTRLKEEEHICEEDEDKLFYCTRSLKVEGCQEQYSCPFGSDQGGLFTEASNRELIHVSGGLGLKYQGSILELGNERHWTYDAGENGCAIREFTAKFYIKDLSKISVFKVLEVFENNLLNIEINGRNVYNGLGGTTLYLGGGGGMGQIVYAGNGRQGTCGINAGHMHWKSHYYDVLANGILKEGENYMNIKLVYHWYGHAGVKIEAKQYCCKKFGEEKWETDCPVN